MDRDYDTGKYIVIEVRRVIPIDFCEESGLNIDAWSEEVVVCKSKALKGYDTAVKKAAEEAEATYQTLSKTLDVSEHCELSHSTFDGVHAVSCDVYEDKDKTTLVGCAALITYHCVPCLPSE